MSNRDGMSNPDTSRPGGTGQPPVIGDTARWVGARWRLAGLWVLAFAFLVAPAAAQTPTPEVETPPPPPFAPWHISEVTELAINGEPVALSPDGRWVAGIGPDGASICAWRISTLRPTCAGSDLRIQTLPLTGTIAWSPDSTAVAFIDGISQLLEPTDVMLFDVTRGTLTSITLTGMLGTSFIHTGPAWTGDGKWVVFAETDPSGRRDQPASIVYYNRDYMISVPVPLKDAFYISAPVVVMPDDSVLFRVEPSSSGTEQAGVWRVDRDGGNLRQVIAGEEDAAIDMPVVLGVSADGAYLSVASASAVARMNPAAAFFIVEVASGDVRQLTLPDDGEVISQAVFDIDQIYAIVQDGAGPGVSLAIMAPGSGDIQRLEGVTLRDSWLLHPPTWARNNAVLIPTADGALLVSLEQDPEGPPFE